MLKGVPALVRGDGDRGQGPALVLVAREAHRALARIVVIAKLADLDADFLQVVTIQQVARQFGAVAREIRFGVTIVAL